VTSAFALLPEGTFFVIKSNCPKPPGDPNPFDSIRVEAALRIEIVGCRTTIKSGDGLTTLAVLFIGEETA
jgi:hypothetical protein